MTDSQNNQTDTYNFIAIFGRFLRLTVSHILSNYLLLDSVLVTLYSFSISSQIVKGVIWSCVLKHIQGNVTQC